MSVIVRIEGMDKILSKLKGPPSVISEPWKRAMSDAGKVAAEALRKRAPVATGYLRKSIKSAIHRGKVSAYAKVLMSWRESKSKARYPWILDVGQRKWRRGRGEFFDLHYSRGGGPTKGWITQTPGFIKGDIDGILFRAGKEIEAAWGK